MRSAKTSLRSFAKSSGKFIKSRVESQSKLTEFDCKLQRIRPGNRGVQKNAGLGTKRSSTWTRVGLAATVRYRSRAELLSATRPIQRLTSFENRRQFHHILVEPIDAQQRTFISISVFILSFFTVIKKLFQKAELLYFNEIFSVEKAKESNIVTRILKPSDFDKVLLQLCQQVSSQVRHFISFKLNRLVTHLLPFPEHGDREAASPRRRFSETKAPYEGRAKAIATILERVDLYIEKHFHEIYHFLHCKISSFFPLPSRSWD